MNSNVSSYHYVIPSLLALAASAASAGDLQPKPPAGSCPVVSAVANIDVPKVSISGSFSVNGAAPFWFASHTGVVELSSATLGTVTLGQLHQQSYQRQVIPGVYDVVYRHQAGTLVPANSHTLVAQNVLIDSAGVFDFSIPAVVVDGDITLAGAVPPQSIYENGDLYFRDVDGGAEFRVGSSKQGSYAVVMVPGDYQIVWKRLLGSTIVPLNNDVVIATTTVQASGSVDIDIPWIEISGDLTLNGATPPSSVYENGRVYLRDVQTGDLVKLGDTRQQQYTARVVPGVYDIVYSHLIGDLVPGNSAATIDQAVPLLASGAHAIDIPAVTIEGSFSLDGMPFPQSIYNNAAIALERDDDDRVVLGHTTAGTYTARVVPGSYDIVYEKLTSTGLVPVNSRALAEFDRAILPARGVRLVNIAVSSGQLDVSSSYWGGPALASIYENGLLLGHGGPGDVFEIGTTQPGLHSVKVVAGGYGLNYAHVLGELVPANGNASMAQVDVASGAAVGINLDLQPGLLSGGYNHAGAAFPHIGQGAEFALRDHSTGDLIELPSSIVGGYAKQLLPGSYDVVYEHVGGRTLAANRGAVVGCLDFQPEAP